jgi:vitamin K-dependent gamma-carboxylase-like protein
VSALAEDGRAALADRGRAALRDAFALDPRSLALFRVGTGALLLADLGLRARNLRALYTDEGVLPRALLTAPAWQTIAPFHLWSGSFAWQAFLFAVAAGFAVLLALGYRTRVAAAASWLLLVSLQARNPVVGHYGDEIFRVVFFWAVFLPLGRCASLDARRRPDPARLAPVVSVAAAALLLQVASIYFFTALLKRGADWHGDGTALYYALSQDWRARPLAALLLAHPTLLRVLTRATLALEFFGPLLLLSPWRNGPLRTLVVLALLGFHAGLGATMHLGSLFPAMACVALSALLPPWFWERLAALRGRAAAPGPPAAAAPARPAAGAAEQALASLLGLLLAYVLAYNVLGLFRAKSPVMPPWLERAGDFLRLNQRWSMYTPNGPRDDGWYVVAGRLEDGRGVEIGEIGGEVRFEKPASLTALHEPRLELFLWRLHQPGTEALRSRYAHWLCRSWNAAHAGPERLESVELYFMRERTRPPGIAPEAVKRRLLEQRCEGDGATPGALRPPSPHRPGAP